MLYAKLKARKFHEIAHLIKGFSLVLLKTLKNVNKELASLVAFEIRQRKTQPKGAQKKKKQSFSSPPNDFRNMQAIIADSMKKASSRPLPEVKEDVRQEDPYKHVLSEPNDRIQSSFKRLLDQAEEQVPDPEFVPVDFEDPMMMEDIRTEKKPLIDDELRELMAVSEERLKKIEASFRKRTPKADFNQKKDKKKKTLTCKIDVIDTDQSITTEAEKDIGDLLDNIVKGDSHKKSIDNLLRDNEDARIILDKFADDILGSGEKMVEEQVRELEEAFANDAEAVRRKNTMHSESAKKLEEIKSSSRRDDSSQGIPDEPFEDHGDQSLDVIFENINENLTKTEMMHSYQAWSQLENRGEVIEEDLEEKEEELRESLKGKLKKKKKVKLRWDK